MVASLAARGVIRDEAAARRAALGATAWPARFEQLDGVGRLRGRTRTVSSWPCRAGRVVLGAHASSRPQGAPGGPGPLETLWARGPPTGRRATAPVARARYPQSRADLTTALWPFRRGARLLLDVAHNEPAVAALLTSVSAAFPAARLAVIYGANGDKDVRAMVRLIAQLPRLAQAVAVQSSHPKAVPSADVVAAAREAAAAAAASPPPPHAPAAATEQVAWCAAASMAEALELAAAPLQGEAGAVVVCCGSVFVAADMRAEVARAEPALFPPTDWVFEEGGEPPLLM